MIPCSPKDITYEIIKDGKAVEFQPCGFVSYHPEDVKNRYCPRCHRFMELVELAAQLRRELAS